MLDETRVCGALCMKARVLETCTAGTYFHSKVCVKVQIIMVITITGSSTHSYHKIKLYINFSEEYVITEDYVHFIFLPLEGKLIFG